MENNANYNEFDLLRDINSFSNKEIYQIIIKSMDYVNFDESPTFMGNINFEMFEYLNKRKKEFFAYKDKEQFFYHSSKLLYDIYILQKLMDKLRYIDVTRKVSYMKQYGYEINAGHYKFDEFDDIIFYIFKKLHNIIMHTHILFDYHFTGSMAQKIFQLSESLKQVFIRGYTSSNRKFPSD